jgi:hypothetical protein
MIHLIIVCFLFLCIYHNIIQSLYDNKILRIKIFILHFTYFRGNLNESTEKLHLEI